MFWSNCMAWSASVWIQTGGTRRVTWVDSTSCLKMAWNSASCMNNSESRLKIALDSTSLLLELGESCRRVPIFSGRVENWGVKG